MTDDFEARVHAVDWSRFKSAHGRATAVGPELCKLSSRHLPDALAAAHTLWTSVCHQHAQVSSAALPALPFLLELLSRAPEALQIEIMDILVGMATCASVDDLDPPGEWGQELMEKLREARALFVTLADSRDETLADFARMTLSALQPAAI